MASEIIKFRVAAGEKSMFVNAAQSAGMTLSEVDKSAFRTLSLSGSKSALYSSGLSGWDS
jgi:hypothetical protein